MSQVHDISDVKERIRKVVTTWVIASNVAIGYLEAVALEDSFLQLIRDLGEPDEAGPVS